MAKHHLQWTFVRYPKNALVGTHGQTDTDQGELDLPPTTGPMPYDNPPTTAKMAQLLALSCNDTLSASMVRVSTLSPEAEIP